jgi:hypothetical protein
MTTCYYCHTILSNRNRSGEHVIPNSIGGSLISYNLLCRSCNIELGETIDAELGRQFERLTISLNIRKHRKNRPGDRRNQDEVGAATENFLDDNFEADPERLNPAFLKAIAKIAVNVFLHFGGERKDVTTLAGVLKGEYQPDKYVKWHRSISVSSDDETAHSVRIRGSAMENKLYADVVLFSSYGFTVCFDDDYRGIDVEYDYVVGLICSLN